MCLDLEIAVKRKQENSETRPANANKKLEFLVDFVGIDWILGRQSSRGWTVSCERAAEDGAHNVAKSRNS